MPDIPCKIAVANREYEAWLLASLESLRGRHGVSETALRKNDPESIRDAKKELSKYMEHKYSPTVDQTALTAHLDIELASKYSKSFFILCKHLLEIIEEIS